MSREMPKGVIAIHGFREVYTREEQIEIARAIKPVLDAMEDKLTAELSKKIVEVSPGVYKEIE